MLLTYLGRWKVLIYNHHIFGDLLVLSELTPEFLRHLGLYTVSFVPLAIGGVHVNDRSSRWRARVWLCDNATCSRHNPTSAASIFIFHAHSLTRNRLYERRGAYSNLIAPSRADSVARGNWPTAHAPPRSPFASARRNLKCRFRSFVYVPIKVRRSK